MNYKTQCFKTIDIVKQAGEFIRKEFHNFNPDKVRFKDKNDLVSYVDVESENFIMAELKSMIPDAGFLAEESADYTNYNRGGVKWIIDPLDGTTNFVHGIPVFSVSVGLSVDGIIQMGVIYEINHDEFFYAYGDGNAYLNGKKIQVSETQELESSLLATGFPFRDFDMLDFYTDILAYFMKHTRGIRRLGSAAADLAYVACGRFDAFYEYGLSPWDVAAGSYIVEQAGGKVSDFSGGNDFLYGKQIIASNHRLYNIVVDELKKRLAK